MEADDYFVLEEEDFWKCRKHPSSRPRSGVCPSCLRDRLLRLCPDCANVRPCSCCAAPSSSSSSFSSHSSSFDPARSSVSGAIGVVGRVSSLIESEPAFRRSRSAAFSFIRRRSDETPVAARVRGPKWGAFLWFLKASKDSTEEYEEESEERSEAEKFSRSRSVGVVDGSTAAAGGKGKGRKWHFPSPMRAFRQKKTAKVVHERSPLWSMRMHNGR